VKNMEDRLIVLNRIARSVIEEARGMHPEYVFVRRLPDGETARLTKMYARREEREGARGERVGAGTRNSGTGGV